MFSNDHNVEIIARLISNLKRYGELQLKGMQLDVVSKLTLVLTLLVVALVLIGVVSIVVLLLSFALVFALAPIVGSLVTSCCLVAGGFVLLSVLLVLFRRYGETRSERLKKGFIAFLSHKRVHHFLGHIALNA